VIFAQADNHLAPFALDEPSFSPYPYVVAGLFLPTLAGLTALRYLNLFGNNFSGGYRVFSFRKEPVRAAAKLSKWAKKAEHCPGFSAIFTSLPHVAFYQNMTPTRSRLEPPSP